MLISMEIKTQKTSQGYVLNFWLSKKIHGMNSKRLTKISITSRLGIYPAKGFLSVFNIIQKE